MRKKDPLEPRYAWKCAHKELDLFVKSLQMPILSVAWTKAQLIIDAQCRFYVSVGNSAEDAVAMAWEDFEMACRGRGEPGISGAAFMLWSRIPDVHDKAFEGALYRAFKSAYESTEPNGRRYLDKDYKAKVHTLSDGFDDPEAIPISITPVKDAPKTASSLRDRINKVMDFSNLTVLEGGKGQTSELEDDVF